MFAVESLTDNDAEEGLRPVKGTHAIGGGGEVDTDQRRGRRPQAQETNIGLFVCIEMVS